YSIDSLLPKSRRSCPPPSNLLATTAAAFAARRLLQHIIAKAKSAKKATIPTPINAPATLESTTPTLADVTSAGSFESAQQTSDCTCTERLCRSGGNVWKCACLCRICIAVGHGPACVLIIAITKISSFHRGSRQIHKV